ncbi:Glutathione S-transferase/chloride channel, C-terminal [Cynara cardunculus var. scolymus]|uniref:glutathione transferase n=1 Tax=Cynara cardunculus var. scolymus TaxID=59895 RepID=A0A124SD76_CYNCS|nr:Glutathione S-transferase/chloride channel, C-terminal [Cynara cardunculus var. scolymus]
MAKKGEIKLLGTPASHFVNRVQIGLNLKCIDYEFISENLGCKSDLLLKSNPVHQRVPVLLHANEPPLIESLLIIEYIDEIFPDVHPILPRAPSVRAHNRTWAYFIDTQSPDKKGEEEAKIQIREAAKLLERVFVECSDGKAYFGGDNIGYLDIALGCFLGWITFSETLNNYKVFDETISPRLVEWAKKMRSHEAVKNALPSHDALLKHYSMIQYIKPPRTA